MDRHPLGAPAHKSFTKILKLYYSKKEAEIVSHMELSPLTAKEISESCSRNEASVTEILESLARRGLVYSRHKNDIVYYMLVPPMPGIFEYSYIKGNDFRNKKKISKLWNDYFEKALGESIHDERGPSNLRVLTLEEQVPENYEIMPFESVRQIIENSKLIALGNCQCRQAANNCKAPLDVCLMFDSWAEFLIERELAKKITAQQAILVLEKAEQAGLIHCTNNAKGSVLYVCNCCSCCCFFMRGILELNHPRAIASSRFYAEVTPEICNTCSLCAARCRFSAITMSDTAEINKDKCYGCGLCVAECPAKAISLKQRPDYIPPAENGAALFKELSIARAKK